jgi:hypothetical protein
MAKSSPLWLKGDSRMQIAEEVAISLPTSILQDPAQSAARMRELGYNTLVLGLHDSTHATHLLEPSKFEAWLHAWELPLIIKPHCRKKGLDALFQRLPSIDAIFIESHPDDDLEATQADLLVAEIKEWEEALQGRARLIFYVPFKEQNAKRQARELSLLCKEAGQNTSIAFSAFQGAPWEDYRPLHPFWGLLAQASELSETPLIPLVNTGLIGFGEGRWPAMPFDLFERCFSRCMRPPFERPIALANQLPGKGSTLECSLFVGARLGLSEKSAEILAEEWVREAHLDFEPWRLMMRKGREIALEMAVPSKTHMQIEGLLARLKYEENYFSDDFVCEVKRLLGSR